MPTLRRARIPSRCRCRTSSCCEDDAGRTRLCGGGRRLAAGALSALAPQAGAQRQQVIIRSAEGRKALQRVGGKGRQRPAPVQRSGCECERSPCCQVQQEQWPHTAQQPLDCSKYSRKQPHLSPILNRMVHHIYLSLLPLLRLCREHTDGRSRGRPQHPRGTICMQCRTSRAHCCCTAPEQACGRPVSRFVRLAKRVPPPPHRCSAPPGRAGWGCWCRGT